VLLTPAGLVAVPWLLARNLPPDEGTQPNGADRIRVWRFIQITTLVPVAVFVLFSLRREVKLDWTGAPWVAALPALGLGIAHPQGGIGRWLRCAWVPTLLALVLLYGAVLYDLTLGIPGVGYGRHAELVPIGWREFGRQVHAIAEQIGRRSGQDPLIVGMDRYAIASELAFYATDRDVSVSQTSSGHLFGQIGLMYERWFPAAEQSGRDLLLVSWNQADLSQSTLSDYVERLDPIQQGLIRRGGEIVRPFYYRLAHVYHPRKARDDH
jgi:dolichol-phosphate mannosyltransferase